MVDLSFTAIVGNIITSSQQGQLHHPSSFVVTTTKLDYSLITNGELEIPCSWGLYPSITAVKQMVVTKVLLISYSIRLKSTIMIVTKLNLAKYFSFTAIIDQATNAIRMKMFILNQHQYLPAKLIMVIIAQAVITVIVVSFLSPNFPLNICLHTFPILYTSCVSTL